MENLQVDADALLKEAANISADLTRRCMILAGQNSILVQQIVALQGENQKLKEGAKDNVTPIKKGDV